MNKIQASFAADMKRRRMLAGLTQEELAVLVNVSVHSIRRWEGGQTVPQSVYRLRAWREALDAAEAARGPLRASDD